MRCSFSPPLSLSFLPGENQHLWHLQGAAVLSLLLCLQTDTQDPALKERCHFGTFPSHWYHTTVLSWQSVSGCSNPGVVMCWHLFYGLHSMAGVGRELWRSFTWRRSYRVMSRQVLSIFRRDSTGSLGSLFQFSVTCKYIFLHIHMELPVLHFVPIVPFLLVGNTGKILAQSSWHLPFKEYFFSLSSSLWERSSYP